MIKDEESTKLTKGSHSYASNKKIHAALAKDRELQLRLSIHVGRWETKKAEMMHEASSQAGWETYLDSIDGNELVATTYSGDKIPLPENVIPLVNESNKIGEVAHAIQEEALAAHADLWEVIYSELNLDKEAKWAMNIRKEIIICEKQELKAE